MIRVVRTERDMFDLEHLECDLLPPEDGLAYVGMTIDKPWGWERQLFALPNLSVWRLHITAEQETSLHCHVRKTVMFVVELGAMVLESYSGNWALAEGVAAVVERGTFHRLRSGVGGVTLLEVESPADKHDLMRLEDRYGREGQAYVPKERIA